LYQINNNFCLGLEKEVLNGRDWLAQLIDNYDLTSLSAEPVSRVEVLHEFICSLLLNKCDPGLPLTIVPVGYSFDESIKISEQHVASLSLENVDVKKLSYLQSWFADARKHDQFLDDTLPGLNPFLIFRPQSTPLLKPVNPALLGWSWMSVRTGKLVSASDLPGMLTEGYMLERTTVDRWLRQLPRLLDRIENEYQDYEPDKRQALKSLIHERVEGARVYISLTDFWRRRRSIRGVPNMGDGTDAASALGATEPWWHEGVIQGLLSERDTRLHNHVAGTWGWEWQPTHAQLDALLLKWEKHGKPPPQAPVEPDPKLEAMLAEEGGEDIAAALGRLAVRLEKARVTDDDLNGFYTRKAPDDDGKSVPPVDGEPDVRRLKTRILTRAERERLFGKRKWPVGSPAVEGFALPVGSVVVVSDESPPYLRGRGWKITPEAKLLAWNWRGEAGVLPVGGVTEMNPFRSEDTVNRSVVPFHESIYYRGSRYWNLALSGFLHDETAYEAEDRRDRMRVRIWSKLRAGELITPSQWAYFFWILMGHQPRNELMPPAVGEWQDRYVDNPTSLFTDQLKFTASPRTQRSEWQDVKRYARKWIPFSVPKELWDHRLVRILEHRDPIGNADALDFLRKVVAYARESPAFRADLPDHPARISYLKIRNQFLGGKTPVEYFEAVEKSMAADKVQARVLADEMEAHRSWMKRHTKLVEVVETGPLELVPWDSMAFPEPLVCPPCMGIEVARGPYGVDFSKTPDQGYGTPDRPAPYVNDEYLIEIFGEGVREVLASIAERVDEPIVTYMGAEGMLLPSEKEASSQEEFDEEVRLRAEFTELMSR
jgi:hypothetical protein